MRTRVMTLVVLAITGIVGLQELVYNGCVRRFGSRHRYMALIDVDEVRAAPRFRASAHREPTTWTKAFTAPPHPARPPQPAIADPLSAVIALVTACTSKP